MQLKGRCPYLLCKLTWLRDLFSITDVTNDYYATQNKLYIFAYIDNYSVEINPRK